MKDGVKTKEFYPDVESSKFSDKPHKDTLVNILTILEVRVL